MSQHKVESKYDAELFTAWFEGYLKLNEDNRRIVKFASRVNTGATTIWMRLRGRVAMYSCIELHGERGADVVQFLWEEEL